MKKAKDSNGHAGFISASKIDALLIFLVFVLFRLKDLGIDLINSDAYWWKTRTYNFGNAVASLDFASTAQTYHPGVTLLWINYVSVKIYSLLNRFIFDNTLSEREIFFVNHIIQKAFLVVVLGVLVTLVYIQLKKLFSTKHAIIFYVLLTFTPFFVALTRVLHTDGILTLTIFLSFLSLLNFYKTKKTINLVISGFWLGLAILTKSNSLIFIPFIGLVMLFENQIPIKKSKTIKDFLSNIKNENVNAFKKQVLIIFGVIISTFILLWPAMWVAPFQTLSKYLFGISEIGVSQGHIHYFLGKFTDNPGLLYYPLALLARVDEILIILFLLGIVWYFKHRSKIENRYILYSLAFIVFYILILSFPSKKLDRYILPTFPFIALIASWFITSISDRLKIKLRLIIPILLINLLITNINFHPDYMAYYSKFVGGASVGRKYIDPTWPIGYASLSRYFNNIENAENFKVAVHDEFSFRPFFIGQTIDIENAKQVQNADFLVTYTFMPEKVDLTNFKQVSIFKVAGVDYYKIHSRIK